MTSVKPNIRECYSLLDLEPGCTIDDLKTAYKDMVQVWHPDRFTHNLRLSEKAEAKLKRINFAYENLEPLILQRQAQEVARQFEAHTVSKPSSKPRFDPIPAPQTTKLRIAYVLWVLALMLAPWGLFFLVYWIANNLQTALVIGALGTIYLGLRSLSSRV
jgi:hypothetical protein